MPNRKAESSGNITAGHVRAFQAVTSRMYDNVTLWSCTINGEPGVAIVMVEHAGEGKVAVMPLFVAITENMEIDFPGEESNRGAGGGGGRRPRSHFDAAQQETTRPAPV